MEGTLQSDILSTEWTQLALMCSGPSPLGLPGSCGDAAALATGLEAAQVDWGGPWLGLGEGLLWGWTPYCVFPGILRSEGKIITSF